MDNEQKYKNALEKVKELLDSAKNQGHIIVRVEDIENAFPELKESEDERIRKEFCKDIRTFIPNEKANKYIAWLEKQGEQTHAELGQSEVTKTSDQKLSVKVEPKFKVKDWIVFNGLILHIDEVVNGFYITTSIGDDIHNSYDWDIDNVARLWNISDAKCGDVLISSPHKQPFVYNGNHTRDDIGSYFGLNYQGELLICDSHGNNWTELTGVQPATEEQCNTLFKKLHDSDYKWDGEKKELWHKYL